MADTPLSTGYRGALPMPLELVRDWVQEYRPNIAFRSPDEREFLPAALEIIEKPASPVGRAMALCICGAAIFALLWATFGKIDIIATAPGKIVAVGNTKTIQPMEIGTVRAIHVANGDVVRKGQVLLELDPTQTAADRDRYTDELRHAELELAKQRGLWEALQRHKTPQLIDVPTDAASDDLTSARFAMQSEYDGHVAALADIDQQIAEKSAEIAAAGNSVAKYEASLPFVQQQADLRSELMRLQFSNRLAYLQAQQALVEQQRQLVVLGDERQQAVAQKLALVQKRKEAENSYQKSVFDDLTKAEQQVSEFRDGKVKAQQELAAKTLRAPIDGTVQELVVHTIGGVVTPAQALMLIVPKNGGVVVEARVNNDDVGFVHAGQAAQVKVNTFNFTRYGLIEGAVINVSSDAVAQDSQQNSAKPANDKAAQVASTAPSYVAYVRLSRNWMITEAGRTSLGPGMEVTTEIHTGRRRIIEYLLSPLQRRVSESIHER
jgi:hemolysin D